MAYKIAVASSDGKVINQHFGRATQFLIFEVDGEDFQFQRRLNVTPFCDNGEHDDNKLQNATEALFGCRAVLTSQIGKGAEQILARNGIESFAIGDFIEDAIKKLARYYIKIDGGLKHGKKT
jgi:nitrogen fixation protein NifX